MNKPGKVELLAPAGDLEKLKFAVLYGADAVYIGGEQFGLRAGAKNFTEEDMKEGIEFAHSRGVKVYLTLNIVPHEEDIAELPAYLDSIVPLGFDSFIISDPGMVMIIGDYLREQGSKTVMHLSTQANTTNSASAKFWLAQGIRRIVLARELSLSEIASIKRAVPEMELEIFVHGAMCISHSGRCLLSNYLTGRDSNRGDCAQPCRWKYHLVEEKRPGQYFEIFEERDEEATSEGADAGDGAGKSENPSKSEGSGRNQGTYIMNSKDLCLIGRLPEIIETGVSSLKIEGRMKTPFYVATVVRAYRRALDMYFADPSGYEFDPELKEELTKTSHRGFTEGFMDGSPGADSQNYESAAYIRSYKFAGVVKGYDEASGLAEVEQRNNFAVGSEIEVIGPNYFKAKFVLEEMYDENMEAIDVARHAKMKLFLKVPVALPEFAILRVREE